MTDALDFLLEAGFSSLPPAVVAQTKRCLLDLIGVAAAGRQTALAAIACDFAARHLGAASPDWSARLLLDGRPASAPGAAFAGAAIIDSFDAHDGHALTKGHAGVAVFPAALAFHQLRPAPDGRSFLADLAVGYELAIRAGIALHATAATTTPPAPGTPLPAPSSARAGSACLATGRATPSASPSSTALAAP